MNKDSHKNSRYFIKSEEELHNETMEKLKANGFNTEKGSIVNLFTNIINGVLATAYKTLEKFHLNCFLSTADSESLNDMAYKKGFSRKSGETDDSLRYRISIADRVNASCNFTSIRQTILNHFDNVYEVKLVNFTQGAGSCSIYIHSADQSETELKKIIDKVTPILPCGVAIRIQYPRISWLKLKIKINTNATGEPDKIDMKRLALNNIEQLFTSSKSSYIVSYYDIINAITSSHELINSASILESTIDDTQIKLQQIICTPETKINMSNQSEIIF